MKLITYCILTLILYSVGYSQDCTDFHQYQCTYADYTFYYSRQSKSLLYQKGQTSELQIVVYEGEDYYISVCSARKIGKIRFRILNDDNERQVLFDNADSEYATSVTFSNESTSNLIIEISTPDATSRDSKTVGCVGVVVQFRKTSG